MNTDCTFRIGRSHPVCQDYAVSRSGERPYVILADGCSSSPDTDVGARLLVRSAGRAWAELAAATLPGEADLAAYHRETLRSASEVAGALGLDPRCLDATLLTLCAAEGRWLAAIAGDGVLAVKRRSRPVQVTAISYTEGCPEYLSYAAAPHRRQTFDERAGNLRRVEEFLSDGSLAEPVSVTEEPPRGPHLAVGETADTEWVAVLSDGAGSFTDLVETDTSRTVRPVPLAAVLPDLLAFRSRTGCFVQRRLQRLLAEWGAHGRHHQDDLAIGAIAFGA